MSETATSSAEAAAASDRDAQRELDELISMKAECWYNLPEMINTGVVLAGIWWWVNGSEWAHSPLTLLGLAFAVGFSLRLLQIGVYSDGFNKLVFNTFGHNVVLWVVVIAEAIYFIDQYKNFIVALGLMGYHLFASNIVDLPGRMLLDRMKGGDARAAFEAVIRARTPAASVPAMTDETQQRS